MTTTRGSAPAPDMHAIIRDGLATGHPLVPSRFKNNLETKNKIKKDGYAIAVL